MKSYCETNYQSKKYIEYIKRVKEALPNIPVGYVDAYYQFIERPELS